MEYIVDRFEAGFALLEPAQGPLRTEQVDAAATAARRERLRRRFSFPKRTD